MDPDDVIMKEYFHENFSDDEYSSDLDDEFENEQSKTKKVTPSSSSSQHHASSSINSEAKHPNTSESSYLFSKEITCVPISNHSSTSNPLTPQLNNVRNKSPQMLSPKITAGSVNSPNQVPCFRKLIPSPTNQNPSLASKLKQRGLEIKPVYMNASNCAKVTTMPSNASKPSPVQKNLAPRIISTTTRPNAVMNKSQQMPKNCFRRGTVARPVRSRLQGPNQQQLRNVNKVANVPRQPLKSGNNIAERHVGVSKSASQMAKFSQIQDPGKSIEDMFNYDFDDCSDDTSYPSDSETLAGKKDDGSREMSEYEVSKALFQLDDISNSSSDEDEHFPPMHATQKTSLVKSAIKSNPQELKIPYNVKSGAVTPKRVPLVTNNALKTAPQKQLHKLSPNVQKMKSTARDNVKNMRLNIGQNRPEVVQKTPPRNVVMQPQPQNFNGMLDDSDSDYGEFDDCDSDEYNELLEQLQGYKYKKDGASSSCVNKEPINKKLGVNKLGNIKNVDNVNENDKNDKKIVQQKTNIKINVQKTKVISSASDNGNGLFSTLFRGVAKSAKILNQAQSTQSSKESASLKLNNHQKNTEATKIKNAINSALNNAKNSSVSNQNKKLDPGAVVIKKGNDDDAEKKISVMSKTDVHKLLSTNKNLTISVVQPVTRQGGGPKKNDLNPQKNLTVNKLAKCPSCGCVSVDVNVCESCHEPIAKKDANASSVQKKVQAAQSSSLSKRQFYGAKLKDQMKQHVPEGSTSAEANFSESTPAKKAGATKKGKAKRQEPVCLTLSSDDEGGEKQPTSTTGGLSDDREDGQSDDEEGSEHSFTNKSKSECSSGRNSPQLEPMLISSRSIRVGSYRIVDKHIVSVTNSTISFPFTACNRNDEVTVNIRKKDIINIKSHFGIVMPVIFITATRSLGSSLRQLLDMPSSDGPYFDPDSTEEAKKRICIIPESISSPAQEFFTQYFNDVLEVIDKETANEMLVKSTPLMQLNASGKGPQTRAASQAVSCVEVPLKPKTPVFHMAMYPSQQSAGRISITTEDYECLYPCEFLNDVIIDFYLKYVFLEKLTDADRERTHIFSSFFYGRLTTKPQSSNSLEDDASLSAQKKRHARVKTWTRHVDIFSKDFIIIPVNEKSHWFLAIICFPGLVPPTTAKRTLDDQDNSNCPPKQQKMDDDSSSSGAKSSNESPDEDSNSSQTSTVIAAATSTNHDEDSNHMVTSSTNESSENNDNMDVDSTSTQTSQNTTEKNVTTATPSSASSTNKKSCLDPETKQKMPCILIFDSLIMPRGHTAIITILREYLTEEWAAKKKSERLFNKDNMKGANLKVPQQDNYSDCGLYVLQYVESFFQTPIINFKVPLIGLESWFPEEIVKTKRQDIQALIKRLASEQGTKYELREYVPPASIEFNMKDSADMNKTSLVIVRAESLANIVSSSANAMGSNQETTTANDDDDGGCHDNQQQQKDQAECDES